MSYERFGTTVTTELLPDGNSVPVTNENRERRLLPQYKCMHRSNHKFVPQCCRVCLSVCEPLAEWVHWEAVYCLLSRLSQHVWLQCSDSESTLLAGVISFNYKSISKTHSIYVPLLFLVHFAAVSPWGDRDAGVWMPWIQHACPRKCYSLWRVWSNWHNYQVQ